MERDTVIAEVRSGKAVLLVRSPVSAIFLSWLATEGETVFRGRIIARLHPAAD